MQVRWSQLCKLREQSVPGTGSPYHRMAPLPLFPPPKTADIEEGERLPTSERTTRYVRSNRKRLKSTTSLMRNVNRLRNYVLFDVYILWCHLLYGQHQLEPFTGAGRYRLTPGPQKRKEKEDDEGSREQKVNRQENNNNKERQIRHRHQRSIRHLGDVPRVHFDAWKSRDAVVVGSTELSIIFGPVVLGANVRQHLGLRRWSSSHKGVYVNGDYVTTRWRLKFVKKHSKKRERMTQHPPSFTAPSSGDDLVAAVDNVDVRRAGRGISLDDLAAKANTSVLRSMELTHREGFHPHLNRRREGNTNKTSRTVTYIFYPSLLFPPLSL